MHLSLHHKLALLFTLIILLISGSIYWSVQSSIKKGFSAYLTELRVNEANRLAESIAANIQDTQQWQAFVSSPRNWHDLIRYQQNGASANTNFKINSAPPLHKPPHKRHRPEHKKHENHKSHQETDYRRPSGPPHRPPPPPPPINITFVLLDLDKHVFFRPEAQAFSAWQQTPHPLVPVVIQSNIQGYIAVKPVVSIQTEAEQTFLSDQLTRLLWIAIIATSIAILLAWPVTRFLAKPIKKLSVAANQVAQKNYQQRVDIRSNDEIGTLANAFNHMVEQLNAHELRQKNWISDISHELRTPIAIMRAEIEAIQDGVRKLDNKLLGTLHSEVMQLTHLVDDLHDITLSDRGELPIELSPLPIVSFIEQLVESRQVLLREKQLSFTLIPPENATITIDADRKRLTQVFANLVQNSVRYTQARGQIRCRVEHIAQTVILHWEDSAPGVPDDALDKLFDRLYRVDKSRSREQGGHGLGLAICKTLVDRHGGSLSASHSELGGLKITIQFPIRLKS